MNDIHVRLKLRQSQASQHLKVLKNVGLVEMEPRAQQRFYRLRDEPLMQLHEWLDRYRHIWEERFEELDEIVEELKEKEKTDGAGSISAGERTKPSWSGRATGAHRHPYFQCAGEYRL